jgi:hypothetical protein
MSSAANAQAEFARFARYVILRNSYNIYHMCQGVYRDMAWDCLADQKMTDEEECFLIARLSSIINCKIPTYTYQPDSFRELPFDATIHDGIKMIADTIVD